jgi:hypothetical protein
MGLSMLMVFFTAMWMVLKVCLASNQLVLRLIVSMGAWLHLWIFDVSSWHIDAVQNGYSYQNIKHANQI